MRLRGATDVGIRHAVDVAGTELLDRPGVTRGAVALVAGEPGSRILGVEVHLKSITRLLREDTRGGDGCGHGVAPDHRRRLASETVDGEAAGQDETGSAIEGGDRATHPLQVAPVD